jgi:hypothetical protein
MGRAGAAAWTALGTLIGTGIGLGVSRLATGKVDSKTRANIVLASTFGGAAAGAAATSYYVAPKLQLTA